MRTALARVATALVLGLSLFASAAAQGNWPERPIRILISFPPAGSTDVIGRILQPGLEKRLGQPVIVENRPGAGGMLAMAAIAKSPPDGYTIGLSGAGALAGAVALGEKMTYDPRKDLAPITALAGSPFMLAAGPSFADASVKGVVAAAKNDKLAIGHGGNGTLMHLTAQMFNQLAGTHAQLVPYKGTATVVTDLLGGHIPLGIVDPPAAGAAFEAGKLKMVGISSTARFPQLKTIRTFEEQGLKSFDSYGWFGMVAPAGTPPAVVARLNEAIVAELKNPAVIERIRSVGSEPMPQTPAEFSAYILREIDKWTKVVKSGGEAK